MAIKTIFFDVGGTLIYPDMERLLAPLLARVRPTAEQLAAADRAAKCSHQRNGDDAPAGVPAAPGARSNKGHWEVFFEALLGAVGCGPGLLPELTARANDSSYWTQLDPDAGETLQKLQRQYRLAVISNADGRIRQVLARAGIAGYFEQIIDSGLVGCEKPDPRIFSAALQAMRAAPGESLCVGDIYAIDYKGSTAAGLHAILMDRAGVYRDWGLARLDSLKQLPGRIPGIA